ncbi:E3 ubiquitin-protein ligase UBR2 [Coccinella septempunctata]|uniref:E3 ubiquitin-protein ligase UBR2 n=1 Tax=Coccinella septempunctata TaxID=41139 RepID=UPI001D06275B|nr:E3 ubiquitin-protein ligase UBR2 [Coccinella septempunctata]
MEPTPNAATSTNSNMELAREASQDFNITTEWKMKFERGELTPGDFEDHWKIWVPHIYSPGLDEDCLSWNFNEELANKLLFNPLMHFVCNGDPDAILADLASKENVLNVCTKVFKMGEPTYSCRECGTDNTCVLCADCFKYSVHKNHKYKMGTSSGGGCCDCGDEEAWKMSPFCDFHKRNQDEVKQNVIPESLKERARIAFEAVLGYSHRLLTTEQVSDIRFNSSADDVLFDIDMYCTILYNDEVHTFEQVISTLSRVLKCNQRSAIAFVTSIDREGRAVVKCSDFQSCNELRTEIEKYTSRHGNKPLKVIVSHAHIIAHQIYAMKLLAWLQGLLSHSSALRNIFAETALKETESEPSIIKSMLLRDSSLWKSARTHWHRLFISGMLPEYENKKALAKIFTKNYGHVLKDFIRDDHDHSYSIASLSVQLFTTPSIALNLIEEEDIFFMLLNTFVSECVPKCNKNGKLEFERNPVSVGFKRAQHMLFDLKYLLSQVPETWNDNLRRNFLHGLNCLYNLLSMMQGMDAVTRQVGQHMEYEPEWESAFNLHIKLAYCITLILNWCGSDKVVLVKAYRAILRCLYENPCFEPFGPLEVRELADHSTSCLHYDISTQKVSIHQPLTRFFAGLHLHLEKYDLAFDSSQFHGLNKPTPVELIEPVLRTQALVAQVHAGMWRRNGYGLLNQLFFYQNVKFRTEMYDRDINALQVGASLIESNEFLIHCLNKFNLINWANNDFDKDNLPPPGEDGMMETINLVEEFLHLLIVLVGERHCPELSFVTETDRIKKDIIHHLCIKPLAHSELTKNLPDEVNDSTIVDDIINELAEFKRGHGSAKGVYELKPEYYNQYNVFYYHYSKEELSKSEVNQRKRRADAGQLECCPPPQLPKLRDSFTMIVNLLQCDVMLHIFHTVLSRCSDLRARSFSESQLHKVLHLIGYALQEEQTNHYPFFKFVENSNKFGIFQSLEELTTCPRVDAHKDLLKWTIHKFKEVANQPDKNAVVPFDEPVIIDDTEKERRAKLAAERRAKILAQMAALQKTFMAQNSQLFDETNPETSFSKSPHHGSAMDITESTVQQVALGSNQSIGIGVEKSYTCILCQEEEIVRPDGPVMVLAAFVQESKVLCQDRSLEMDDLKLEFLHANLGPAPHTNTCGHAMHSKCWEQYYEHVTGREHRRPYRLRHPASFDVDKQEYLCPLCECLSNTALPIVPSLCSLQPVNVKSELTFENFVSLLHGIVKKKVAYCHGVFNCDKNCENEHCDTCTRFSRTTVQLACEGCEAKWMGQAHKVFFSIDLKNALDQNYEIFSTLFSSEAAKLDLNLLNVVETFAQVPFSKGTHSQPESSSKKPIIDGLINPFNWKSLAYTIHSIEMVLRDTSKPLLGQLSSRQRDGIENFIKVCAILSCSPKSSVNKCYALEFLDMLLDSREGRPSILDIDSFGILVALTFSLPSLTLESTDTPVEYLSVHLPTGGTLESHTLRLVYTLHIVKQLLALNRNENPGDSMEIDGEEDTTLMNLMQVMNKQHFNISTVWNRLQEATLPFLRCCVLFYHYLTEVPADPILLEVSGDTFSNMCSYLNLPENPKDIFIPEIMETVEKWCKHPVVQKSQADTSINIVKQPIQVSRLVDLPVDYSELINSVSSFTCPKSDHEDARNPTMCLVCGEILCSQSYCCQTDLNKIMVGACNYHAHVCGADVGIFLRVRDCEILLLASPHRGCFMAAPYLDSYGETDQGLKRGNPLKLCPERYKKLQLLWLNHGILEEIARTLEGNSSHVGATQWHHL